MERKMEKQKDNISELDPNQIVRFRQGRKYFGYGPTQLDLKIRAGEIPAPITLSDTGRAKGWLGQQIIDHHRRMLAAAATPCHASKPTKRSA
jgi:hypothetical protein